ncbi:MAG: Nucleoside diphosphate kinase A [Marteilia pararefringens]
MASCNDDSNQSTLVLIKPEAVSRGLAGQIITRYEQKGLKIAAMKLLAPCEQLIKEHYDELKDKPFFPHLVADMAGKPLIAMVLTGPKAVAYVRKLNGATNPLDAEIGSIRGDFCTIVDQNAAHGSDSAQSAVREIKLWFPDHQI